METAGGGVAIAPHSSQNAIAPCGLIPQPARCCKQQRNALALSSHCLYEQLRVRAEAVYKGALDGYQQLIGAWFPQLAPGLQIAAMLPARLVGVITPPLPNPGPFGCPPAFNWYLEALSENEDNDVQISISEHYLRETHRDRMRSASCQLRSLRPKSAVWIRRTPCMGNFPDDFFCNTPATAIAYSWLWRDLRKVYWVDNILCRTRVG